MTKNDFLLIKEVSVLALPIALAAILDFLLSKDTLLVIWVIAIEFGLYLLQWYRGLLTSEARPPIQQSLRFVLPPLARHFASTHENARREAEAIVERARTEIQQERDHAITELRAEFSDLAITAAERVLGQSVDAGQHQRLIQEVLAESSFTASDGSQN